MKDCKKQFLKNMNEKSSFDKILKISKLIAPKKRYIIFVLLFFGAVLELIGLSSIGPFLTLMIDPERILEIEYIKNNFEKFPHHIQENYLILFGFLLIFLFLFIYLFLSSQFFYIEKVFRKFSSELSSALLKKYMQNNYGFFIKNNINELSKNILIETTQLIYGILVPITMALSKLFVILFILSFLIYINFKATILLITLFLLIFFSIYFFVKKKLSLLGNARANYDKKKFITTNDSFESIKEAKLLNIENFFIDRYIINADKFANIQIEMNKYILFPKYFVEYLVFTTLILTIMIVSVNGKFINYLPLLSIYVFAGYRILPGLQLILNAISSIKKSEKSLNIIYNEYFKKNKEFDNFKYNHLLFKKKIFLNKVSFKFDENSEVLFENLTLEINKNAKIAIFGKTGVGKSTLIDLIVGLYDPTNGSIEVDQQKLNETNKRNWQQLITYIPQRIFLYESSVISNIALGYEKNEINLNKAKECLNFAELDNFDLDQKLSHNGNNLSGGEKQRLGIARAIYSDRPIIILDESTNALDKKTELKILKKLMRLDKTLIMITHNYHNLNLFDKFLYFSEEEMIFDETKNLSKYDYLNFNN